MQRRRERPPESKTTQDVDGANAPETPAGSSDVAAPIASNSAGRSNDANRVDAAHEADGLSVSLSQGESVSAHPNDDSNGKHGGSADPSQKDAQITPIEIVVPAHIGRYTLGGKLGSGTCGVVHKALDTVLDREVAIKLSPVGEPHLSTGKVPIL